MNVSEDSEGLLSAFMAELDSLYAKDRTDLSKSSAPVIAENAINAKDECDKVVRAVEQFIQKCKPEKKLVGLQVIDAIVRTSRNRLGTSADVFGPQFAQRLQNTFGNVMKCVEAAKPSVRKVISLWKQHKIFTDTLTDSLTAMLDLPLVSNEASLQKDAQSQPQVAGQFDLRTTGPHQSQANTSNGFGENMQEAILRQIAESIQQIVQQATVSTSSQNLGTVGSLSSAHDRLNSASMPSEAAIPYPASHHFDRPLPAYGDVSQPCQLTERPQGPSQAVLLPLQPQFESDRGVAVIPTGQDLVHVSASYPPEAAVLVAPNVSEVQKKEREGNERTTRDSSRTPFRSKSRDRGRRQRSRSRSRSQTRRGRDHARNRRRSPRRCNRNRSPDSSDGETSRSRSRSHDGQDLTEARGHPSYKEFRKKHSRAIKEKRTIRLSNDDNAAKVKERLPSVGDCPHGKGYRLLGQFHEWLKASKGQPKIANNAYRLHVAAKRQCLQCMRYTIAERICVAERQPLCDASLETLRDQNVKMPPAADLGVVYGGVELALKRANLQTAFEQAVAASHDTFKLQLTPDTECRFHWHYVQVCVALYKQEAQLRTTCYQKRKLSKMSFKLWTEQYCAYRLTRWLLAQPADLFRPSDPGNVLESFDFAPTLILDCMQMKHGEHGLAWAKHFLFCIGKSPDDAENLVNVGEVAS